MKDLDFIGPQPLGPKYHTGVIKTNIYIKIGCNIKKNIRQGVKCYLNLIKCNCYAKIYLCISLLAKLCVKLGVHFGDFCNILFDFHFVLNC